jgi:hypothetical protein
MILSVSRSWSDQPALGDFAATPRMAWHLYRRFAMTACRKRYPPRLFLLLHQSKAVQRTLSACAIAFFVVSLAAIGASAKTKPGARTTGPAASNSAIIECVKGSGGSYDPVRKMWIVQLDESSSTVRTDSLRHCIGRARGVSPGSVPIREMSRD